MIHQFNTSPREEAILQKLSEKDGMTVDEFIDAYVIQKFLAEIIERAKSQENEGVKAKYDRASDTVKQQIKDLLNQV